MHFHPATHTEWDTDVSHHGQVIRLQRHLIII
jgi:hypothetical protein